LNVLWSTEGEHEDDPRSVACSKTFDLGDDVVRDVYRNNFCSYRQYLLPWRNFLGQTKETITEHEIKGRTDVRDRTFEEVPEVG